MEGPLPLTLWPIDATDRSQLSPGRLETFRDNQLKMKSLLPLGISHGRCVLGRTGSRLTSLLGCARGTQVTCVT